jgi:hypothetical protein
MDFMTFDQTKHLFSSNICENLINQCESLVEMFVLIFYTPLELKVRKY